MAGPWLWKETELAGPPQRGRALPKVLQEIQRKSGLPEVDPCSIPSQEACIFLEEMGDRETGFQVPGVSLLMLIQETDLFPIKKKKKRRERKRLIYFPFRNELERRWDPQYS